MTPPRPFPPRPCLLVLLVLPLALLFGTPCLAETLFAVPPGGRLAIEQSLDDATWAEARRCLPAASRVGAQYYAVVVNDLDAPGRPAARAGDAVPFVDAAYQAWRAADPSALDPDRHVLLGLALEDRAVAIHPGHEWAEMGLEGGAITRLIDESEFADRARSGDLARAVCELAEAVDDWIAAQIRDRALAREAAAAEAARRDALRRAAPFVALGVVLLLAFLLFLWQLARVRRLKATTRQEVDGWQAQLAVAAERLLELERLHPVYFTAAMRRWTGRSRDLDRRCADAVNRVYLLYSRASLLAGRATDELRVTGALRTGPVRHARSFLHSAPVVIEEGVPAEGDDRRRIFVPLMQEVRTTAGEVLDLLDQAYGEALDLLSEVAELESRHDEAVARAGRQAEAALEAVTARRDLGLPVSHLDEALEDALDRRDLARGELRSDPVAALELLEPCSEDLRAVAERAELGNAVVRRLRANVAGRAEALRHRIEELRGDGYRLEEPGFQPDLQLDRGADDAEAVEQAVAEGRETQADEALADLEAALDDLSAQIEASAAARDQIPEELEARRAEIEEVRGQLPEARRVLEQLSHRHAPGSWREESDNVEEILEILERLDRTLDRIRRVHGEQMYLSALEDLATCRVLLDQCEALLDEIEIIESVLDGCRSRSLDLTAQVEALAESYRARRERPGVGADARRRGDELLSTAAPLLEACATQKTDETDETDEAGESRRTDEAASPRPPDWTELEPALAAVRRGLTDLLADVDRNVAAHAKARALKARLSRVGAELLAHIKKETRDRPHVETSLRQVNEDIDAWVSELEQDETAARDLLRRGEQLVSRLEWVRGVWRSEMDVVNHAEALLRAAEHTARQQLGRSLGHGVEVRSGLASRALERAREAAQRREWEQVAEAAQKAQAQIEDAVLQAEAQVRRREQAERAELAATVALEVLRIGVAMAAGRAGGRRDRSSLPSWPTRSSASSSKGSLRRGGSGKRSKGGWGGSRSGGSRW